MRIVVINVVLVRGNVMLSDTPAERAVLGGIYKYGEDVFIDVADFLQPTTFTDTLHQALYKCFEYLFKNGATTLDQPSIMAAANELKLNTIFEKMNDVRYIQTVCNTSIDISNVKRWAAKIRKLEIARLLQEQLQQSHMNLEQITGTEPIEQILGIAENAIFDFSSLIQGNDSEPKRLGDNVDAFLDYLEANPVDIVGISSGMPYYDQAIGGGFRRKTVSLIGARPKALRYGSKVYTPIGPKNIEDVKVGDIISHPFLDYTKVTAVYDHQNIDIYRIYFRDGDFVDCCKDHLWEVFKRYPYDKLYNKKAEHKTTTELINDIKIGNKQEYKWDIRLPNLVNFQKQSVELDPYILGLLIGNGCFGNSITFTHCNGDDELIDYIRNNISNDIKFDNNGIGCKTYRINGLQSIIRSLGLFRKTAHHKFIPKQYIYNTADIRLAILRGIMDTDGTCVIDKRSNSSRSKYTTVSHQLAINVKEIVQSLGGLCSINNGFVKYNGTKNLYYCCEIRLPKNMCPFLLKRKANLYNNRIIGELKRTIIKIEKIGVDNARCLAVEANDGLFMTDNYVVTHNTGKSMLACCMSLHISNILNIPVLYLDTEMTENDHLARVLPNIVRQHGAGVTINEIETGQYSTSVFKRSQVRQASEILKAIPFYHRNVSGKSFEEIVSIMQRWVRKVVGYDENGNTKDCLIIYDYMKLMNASGISESMKEYQLLGFMTTTLHNFAVRHDVPIVSFIQLNRDGIDQESSAAFAQSDRILWLVTNYSIFKAKAPEDIADCGPQFGNRKLIPISARHGAGIEIGDYINLFFEGKFGYIKEGETRNNIKQSQRDGMPRPNELVDPVSKITLDDDEPNESVQGPRPTE